MKKYYDFIIKNPIRMSYTGEKDPINGALIYNVLFDNVDILPIDVSEDEDVTELITLIRKHMREDIDQMTIQPALPGEYVKISQHTLAMSIPDRIVERYKDYERPVLRCRIDISYDTLVTARFTVCDIYEDGDMTKKKFEDYGFKPSAVIEALNKWYEHGGSGLFCIELPDSKEEDMRFQVFRMCFEAAIDDAIKYLRSMDIFYTPGMKWDDVKFRLSTEACNAEYGFSDIHDAWPKVNPLFVGPRTERENEIRDYILKQAEEVGIKLPMCDESPENIIRYLCSLLVRNRINAKAQRERADGYLEKVNRLQKELDGWERWYNDKGRYYEKPINTLNNE